MNKLRTLFISIFLYSILSGCSTPRESVSGYSYESVSKDQLGRLNEDEYHPSQPDPNNKKILFSATLSLSVSRPDSAVSRIAGTAARYKGYIQETGTYRSVIRAPAASLNPALADLSDIGKVRSKSVTGQDVTSEYLDHQIRLDNAQKARERYLELLARAENVEAALKVEKELERLNETIDLLKGHINRIDHLNEYSTITVYLKEKKKPGVLGYVGMGLYYSVKWLFVRN